MSGDVEVFLGELALDSQDSEPFAGWPLSVAITDSSPVSWADRRSEQEGCDRLYPRQDRDRFSLSPESPGAVVEK